MAECRSRFLRERENAKQDRLGLTCLRSVLMKPEHLDWLDRIWAILDQAAQECMGRWCAVGNGASNSHLMLYLAIGCLFRPAARKPWEDATNSVKLLSTLGWGAGPASLARV